MCQKCLIFALKIQCKRPGCLGQNEGKLKKLEGVFPITRCTPTPSPLFAFGKLHVKKHEQCADYVLSGVFRFIFD